MSTTFVSAIWLPLLLMLGCGGASGGKDESCRSYCTSLCDELAQCPNSPAPARCLGECLERATLALCEDAAQGLSNASCERLTEASACQFYCGALCKQVQACSALDEASCVAGCDEITSRLICDESLIAARECPDLLVEAQCYLSAARDLAAEAPIGEAPPGFFDCFNAPQRGACDAYSDCPEREGCNMKTHLCGSCANDVDCGVPYDGTGAFACSKGKCEPVECTTDAHCMDALPDCGGQACDVCDVSEHICVGCLSDTDCWRTSCDVTRRVCDMPLQR